MNYALIFAGGVGKRMGNGDTPKQFLKYRDKEIIIYTLEHFQKHPLIDGIVVACVRDWIPYLETIVKNNALDKVKAIIPGGSTGQESIYNALKKASEMGDETSVVLIHDGVRPLINAELITNCINTTEKTGNAITIAPSTETIIHVNDGKHVEKVLDRSTCFVARAPQCFKLGELMEAHREAQRIGKNDFIDSAMIMSWRGHILNVVEGPSENIKITTPVDFCTFKAYIEEISNE